MTGELLLIALIALLVFHPKKWPMVIRHAGILVKRLKSYQATMHAVWTAQWAEVTLLDHEKKAKDADALYASSKDPHT
ncbi:MAG: twin-arginine translocase TatA/TatE family subunit [Legionellaceae bacterium]